MQRQGQFAPHWTLGKKAAIVVTLSFIAGLFTIWNPLVTNINPTIPPAGPLPPPHDVVFPVTASFGIVGFYDSEGYAYDVCVSGSITYVANGDSGLLCVNVSNPANPLLLGNYTTPDTAWGVDVEGSIAYVAAETSGLLCFNISNPTTPTLLGTYDTPGYARKVCVDGLIAYVADYQWGLQCINVSNPAGPVLIGTHDVESFAWDVYVGGGVAYVANYEYGLQCFNVSNPRTPTPLGTYDTPDVANGVDVVGSVAYVANYGTGLLCLNISNPMTPSLLGTYNTPNSARDVSVSGLVAYVADYTTGLLCINISNPAAPTLLATYSTPAPARALCVSGQIAYIADYTAGLQCIQIAEFGTPYRFGAFSGGARGICVCGTIAYVAGWEGLSCIDVSNPAAPEELGHLSTPGYGGYDVDVIGTVAYLAAHSYGLLTINVSNPAEPQQLARYTATNLACSVEVSGNVAYVAQESGTLHSINVSNPMDPQKLGQESTSFTCVDVEVSGNLAYVVDDMAGVYCINVSNPSKPNVIESYATTSAEGVRVSGGIAYVACGLVGLQCINWSNPKDPILISTYDTPGFAYDVDVSGGVAYVSDNASGLQCINVSNPANPTLLGNTETFGETQAVAVSGNVAFVADYASDSTCVLVGYHEWDLPHITDNQMGDDTWRDTPGSTYDVDFSAGLANISHVQYRICDTKGQGGTVLKDWTEIATSVNSTTYTANWTVDFTACQEGSNFISVRVFDYVGASQITSDVFHVRKDTLAPGIIDNQPDNDTWQRSPGTTYDVDFSDAGTNLSYAQYKICSDVGQGGTLLKDWTDIVTALNTTIYTTNWTVDFAMCQEGTNYVSVRSFDQFGHEAIVTDAFYFKKDSISPTIQVHTPASLTYTNCPTINVTFQDPTSYLKYAYYRIDSLSPGGMNPLGWVALFADAGSASETIEFTLDAATWAGLTDGSHIVYFKMWDYAANVGVGDVYSWEFTKYTVPSGDDTDDGFLTGLLVGIIAGAAIILVIALFWARSRKGQGPTRVIPPIMGSEKKPGETAAIGQKPELKPSPKLAPTSPPAKKVEVPKSTPTLNPAKTVDGPKLATKPIKNANPKEIKTPA